MTRNGQAIPPPAIHLSLTDRFSSALTILAIVVSSTLISVQFRLTLPYGGPLDGSNPQPLALYVLLVAASGVAVGIGHVLASRQNWSSARFTVWSTLLALALSVVGAAIFLPAISPMQLFYYSVFGILIDLVVILWPARALTRRRRPALRASLSRLWATRTLLGLWIANNVRARYAQAVLGILWVILQPLIYAAILSFVFSQIVRMSVGDVPFISFFLAALTPWNLLQGGVISATGSITGYMGLINQVYFPREVLVLVRLGEALVDFGFQFVAMLIINALFGLWPNIYFLYLPLVLLITLCLVLGLMFFVSYLTVLLRDIPQLVFVIFQMLFYLTPILYPLEFLPTQFKLLALVNPVVPLIQAYRDIIVYGHAPDVLSLCYPLVAGVCGLYLGYNFFKANEGRLADFL